MWSDVSSMSPWAVLAICSAALAVAFVLTRSWCPLGCVSRQPKAYNEEFSDEEEDPLLPPLSPIVYYFSGHAHDFEGLLYSLARARSAREVNNLLPGSALEWMFTTSSKAQQFVALCDGNLDFSVITVNNLASLVVGLHKYAAHEAVAQFISNCLRGKTTSDLLKLKHEIEKRVSLWEVVYRHIDSILVRESILLHFEQQSRIIVTNQHFEPPVKLLSEIDDTVFAVSSELRYPKLTVYPGVHQFSKEVLASKEFFGHRGHASLDHRDQRQVFFTNRSELGRKTAEAEVNDSGFTYFTLMTTSIKDMISGSNALVPHKLQAIAQYKRVFGECDLVYIGNNAREDVIRVGVELALHPELYGVSTVLVHDVSRLHPPGSSDTTTERRFFRTYVGAAFHLYQLDMLSIDAVVRVARAASTAFRGIPFQRSEQQDEAAREFAEEIVDVLEVVAHSDAVALVRALPPCVTQLLTFAVDTLDDEYRIV